MWHATLWADLTDWGYEQRGWSEPSPLPSVPYDGQEWGQVPPYVSWYLRSVDGLGVQITITHVPRTVSTAPAVTRINRIIWSANAGQSVSHSVDVPGYQYRIGVQLAGVGAVRVVDDQGILSEFETNARTPWASSLWWVLGTGNSGAKYHRTFRGYPAQYVTVTRTMEMHYYRAVLSVQTREGTYAVAPDDADQSASGVYDEVTGALVGFTGDVISGATRQVLSRPLMPMGPAPLRMVRGLVCDWLAEQPVDHTPPAQGSPWAGYSNPVPGWFAGLTGSSGYWGFPNQTHLTPRGGMLDLLPRPPESGTADWRYVRRVWYRGTPRMAWCEMVSTRIADAELGLSGVTESRDTLRLVSAAQAAIPVGVTVMPPTGSDPRKVGTSLPGGWISDTVLGVRQYALSVGCRPTDDGVTVYAVAMQGGASAIASLTDEQLGGSIPWPWLYEAGDGRLLAGLLAGGAVREWQSWDGASWTLACEEPVDGSAGVWCPSIGWGPGQTLALVACDQAAGQLLAWCRHGYDEPWQGPAVVAEVDGITPAYITEQPDGRWEVGWRAGGEWHHADAAWPTGTWEVRDA